MKNEALILRALSRILHKTSLTSATYTSEDDSLRWALHMASKDLTRETECATVPPNETRNGSAGFRNGTRKRGK
jgi:hypothetical protein